MARMKSMIVSVAALLIGFAGCHHSGSTVTPSASDVTEFDSAVRDGDTDIISRLLQAKPEMINAKDENGKTPLTIANEKGDQDMTAFLQKHGGHS